jgi:hypothetical protein
VNEIAGNAGEQGSVDLQRINQRQVSSLIF